MGEMADFELETVMEYEDKWAEYINGDMSDEEAYEAGLIDERGSELYEGPRGPFD